MSHFLWLGRWLSVIALLAFVSLARPMVAFGDCNPGFGMCNHQKGTPATLTDPLLFVVYWGSDWGNGKFQGGNPGFSVMAQGVVVTAAEYVTYLEEFLQTIAGTDYLGTQVQYGAGNVTPLFFGDWFDQTGIPDTPTDGQIAGEVSRALSHFSGIFGSNDQVIIIVALPPGHGTSDFKSGKLCAYHSYTNLNFGQKGPPWAYYIVLPFEPEESCGVFSPNPSTDSFGHGVLDGVSHGAGHELAEVLTDPVAGSWYQNHASDGETGDLCADTVTNIGEYDTSTGTAFYWATQALWSNSDIGCVFGDSPNVTAPLTFDFGQQLQNTATSAQNVGVQNVGTADFLNVSQPFALELEDDLSNSFIPEFEPTCPKVLHPGDVCPNSPWIQFIPSQIGTLTATLYFNSNSGGTVEHVRKVLLTGTGLPPSPPVINWVPNFHFPPGLLSTLPCEDCPQVPQQGQISNQDSSPHTIGNVSLSELAASDFAIANDGCSGVTLEGGGSCHVGIFFTPQATGERFGLVNFLDETGVEHSAVLSGVGLGPAAQVTGAALAATGLVFPPGALGTTLVEPITLTSGGQAPLTINSITAKGDFTETNNCPPRLAIGASCTINVSLTPTHYQYQGGVLTVTDDASDSPQTVQLFGLAEASVALASPSKLRFGCVPVNVASDPLKVRLTGLEGEPFHITSIAASGDFSESNDCSSPVTSPCNILVVFKPSIKGKQTATLTVDDDATNGNQQVTLKGVGVPGHEDCEHMRGEGQRRDCEEHRRDEGCDDSEDNDTHHDGEKR